MCRRNGNPKRISRYICCRCGKVNGIEIMRIHQREKWHVKDLYCRNCDDTTKNLECRSCDWMEEIKQKIPELNEAFYS